MFDILEIFGLMIALGVMADQAIKKKTKDRLVSSLFALNNRELSEYVAGNSRTIYEYIFDYNILSRRFFFRSIIYTITASLVGIYYIYLKSPHTYLGLSSFIRNINMSELDPLALIIPAIIFLITDYLCNGQTKYFLELMEKTGSFWKTLTIGYADLVITISLALLSACASMLFFSYFIVVKSNIPIEIEMIFDVTNIERMGKPVSEHLISEELDLYFLAGSNEQSDRSVLPYSYILPHTKSEKRIYKYQEEFLKKHPESDGYRFVKVAQDDNLDRIFFQQIGANGAVYSLHYERDEIFTADVGIIGRADRTIVCDQIAKSVLESNFPFHVENWNESEVRKACVAKKSTAFTGEIRWKDESVNFGKLLFEFLGEVTGSTAAMLFTDVSEYHMVGPARLATMALRNSNGSSLGFYLIGENKDASNSVAIMLRQAWSAHYGGTNLEKNGFPWSTFIVTTIFTSSFIWIVILVSAGLYPFIFLLDRAVSIQKHVKLKKYPFSLLSLVLCVYVALIYFLFF